MKPPQYIRDRRFWGSQLLRAPDKLASRRIHMAPAATATVQDQTARDQAKGLHLPAAEHWHPVVDVSDDLIGPGGNDRAGVKFLAVRRRPGVKKAGKGERFSVPHGNSHRLFASVHLLPLVEAVGGDHAALAFKQPPKSRLLLQRFGARVDHLVSDLLILRPRRNQAPA